VANPQPTYVVRNGVRVLVQPGDKAKREAAAADRLAGLLEERRFALRGRDAAKTRAEWDTFNAVLKILEPMIRLEENRRAK
jgi:hypothetical protein